MKVIRTRQCAKCPWRKDSDPYTIPGYSLDQHEALAGTIAPPGEFRPLGERRVMQCHEHDPGHDVPCVGWLANQLGPGNNISLRLAVVGQRVDLKLCGPQHACFEDTLPCNTK